MLRLGAGAAAPSSARADAAPFATRVLDDRVLHWAGGVMTVLDAWSVLLYPLAGTERAAFESLFALNLEGIDLPAVPAADIRADPHGLPRGAAFAGRRAPRPRALRAAAVSLVAAPEAFVEPVPGGSRVARRATFHAAVPPAGPGESVRKTLVFHLAMDLLGLGEAPP